MGNGEEKVHKIKAFYIAYAGKCLVVIAAFLFVLAVVSLFVPKKIIKDSMVNKNNGTATEEILDGRLLEVNYRSDVNDLLGVKLQFATFQRVNDAGYLHIEILEEGADAPLSSYQIETRHISDGLVVDFAVPRQTDSLGQNYVIRIESEGCYPGNAVALFTSSDSSDILNMQMNGEPLKEVPVFGTQYVGTSYPYTWTILLASALFLTLAGAAPVGKTIFRKRKAG